MNILAPLLLLQALSSMAASLVPRGENSGVITALLRNPKGSGSLPRDLHIRQNTCPAGSYACADGESVFPLSCVMHHKYHISSLGNGCCNVGFDCVVVSGKSGCCPSGSTCGGTPVCQNPLDKLCPGGEFCCREYRNAANIPNFMHIKLVAPGDRCLPNFTCGTSGGGPGGFTSSSSPNFTSTKSTPPPTITPVVVSTPSSSPPTFTP
jgi:hypothetical protein